MWNDDDDDAITKPAVKLFLPIHPARKTNLAPLESHIGGHCYIEDGSMTPLYCDHCHNSLYLMLQLKLSSSDDEGNNRLLCLFVCPGCFGQLEYDKGFSSGGQGLVQCVEHRVATKTASTATTESAAAPIKSSWHTADDDDDDNDDDDWALDGAEGTDAMALEQAVAAMEDNLDQDGKMANQQQHYQQRAKKSMQSTVDNNSNNNQFNAFPCYMLKEQDEPLPPRPQLEEDDVGMADSDEKIRNMLARYMAEEEDEDILAALRGTEIGGGGGVGEEDERLSDEDRILRGFQDRLRRLPRQVVRYARGGMPLWSIPDKKKKAKHFWNVPNCECCQQPRTFECQVLPSILETLEVDKYVGNDNNNNDRGLDDMLSDGINFGSIAIFTCSNPSCRSSNDNNAEPYVVIQKSVDDMTFIKRPAEGALPSATMAVVEQLDDDDEFEPDQ